MVNIPFTIFLLGKLFDKLTIFIDITLQKLKLNAAYTQQIAHTGFLSSSTKQTYRFDDPLLLYSE